jgi:tetratricopeptide (TPR) repeat protein
MVSSKKKATVKKPPNRPVAWTFLGLQQNELLLIGIAVAIRLLYLIYLSNTSPFFRVPLLDAKWHHLWAMQVAHGEIIGKTAFFRAPLYPYFLGVIYAIFGSGPWAPLIIQALISGLSCFFLYRIVKKVWNMTIAIWSGYTMAFCPTLIYFSAELLIETLLIFLFLLALWSWLLALNQSQTSRWLITGMLFGLSAIARPTVLPSLMFLILWYLWKNRNNIKVHITKMAVLMIGCIIPIIPVTLHNVIVSKDLVFISSQGGVNFYIGNNPESDGFTAHAPGGEVLRTGAYQDNVWYSSVVNAEHQTGRNLKPSEISNFWLRKGLQSWIEHPLTLATLTLKKIALLFGAYDIEDNLSIAYRIRHNPILMFLPFRWGWIIPFALWGIAISRNTKYQEWLLIVLVTQALVVVGFFVTARFRQPMIPLLIPFGIIGVDYLLKYRRKMNKLIAPVLAIVVVSIVVHLDPWGLHQQENKRIHFALALAYSQLHQTDKSLHEYDLAITADSTNLEARFNRAQILFNQGNLDRAFTEYHALTNSYPDYAPGWVGLGAVYQRKQLNNSADSAWEHALKLDPYYLDPLLNLGSAAYDRKDYDSALRYFRHAVEIAPESDITCLKLGVALAASGALPEAIQEFEIILKQNPNHVAARRNLELCRNALKSKSLIPSQKSANNP